MRKIISVLTTVALLIGILPGIVFAVTPQILILNITLAVAGSPVTNFQPASGQLLDVNVNFNTEGFSTELNNSNGYVIVKKDNTTIKTLASWTGANAATTNVADWDGRSVDVSVQGVCGSS